jgi:hypothetical protein
MNDLELADLYDKSADVLEDKGWCRHTLWDAQGRVCARGALMFASLPGYSAEVLSISAMLYGIDITEPDARLAEILGIEDVALWNNTVAKDEYEIIDGFRTAAKELRNDAAR